MVWICYFIPLLVAIGATEAQQHEWVDGYLARLASDVIGPWLGAWTVFAAGISNIALFQAELSADAFQLMGMADRGHIPSLLSKRSRHGTPTNGILLGTIVIVVMSVSRLDTLIEMLNFNYALSLLMEYAAFVKLRIDQPELERPYKIPLGTVGSILLILPAFGATVFVLLLATFQTMIFALFTNLVGFAMYSARQNGWCGRSVLTIRKYAPIAAETDAGPYPDAGDHNQPVETARWSFIVSGSSKTRA